MSPAWNASESDWGSARHGQTRPPARRCPPRCRADCCGFRESPAPRPPRAGHQPRGHRLLASFTDHAVRQQREDDIVIEPTFGGPQIRAVCWLGVVAEHRSRAGIDQGIRVDSGSRFDCSLIAVRDARAPLLRALS